MKEIVLAFGWGLIRIIIGLFFGTGVGLLTFGMKAGNNPQLWHQNGPPAEMYMALGAGTLTAGFVMFLLFAISWPGRSRRHVAEHPATKPAWAGEV